MISSIGPRDEKSASRSTPILRLLLSPFTVVAFILGGVLCGIYLPDVAKALAPIGDIYLALLKMAVLPFMASSIIFSMRSMVGDPEFARYLVADELLPGRDAIPEAAE